MGAPGYGPLAWLLLAAGDTIQVASDAYFLSETVLGCGITSRIKENTQADVALVAPVLACTSPVGARPVPSSFHAFVCLLFVKAATTCWPC